MHCHCHGTCSHRNRRRTRHNRHNRLWLRLRCLHLHLERLTRHHASGHREHEQLSWVQNVGIDDQKEEKTKGQKEEGKGASFPLPRQCHCKMPYPRELGDNVSSRVCAVSVRRLERIFPGPKFPSPASVQGAGFGFGCQAWRPPGQSMRSVLGASRTQIINLAVVGVNQTLYEFGAQSSNYSHSRARVPAGHWTATMFACACIGTWV